MGANIYGRINPRDKRTEGEEYLLNIFKNSKRFDGWDVYEQPHINSLKPDFVLLNPDRGMIIIEVKDWDLRSNTYESGGYIRGTNNKLIKKNPVDQVEKYKQCIINLDLETNEDFYEKNKKAYYSCIETAVYFHKTSKSEALNFCNVGKTYTKIWNIDDIDYIADMRNRLTAKEHTYGLTYDKSKLDGLHDILSELRKYFQYADYNYERREPFKLTADQKSLAKLLKSGSIRRWGGVAGAGKSLVLAQKAAMALKKDKRVIILTFNITLRHYLRDLCSQQFGTGSYEGERKKLKQNLTITHFHGFLKSFVAEHGISIEKSRYEDVETFTKRTIQNIIDYLKNNPIKEHFNYDYILVDEGQDFNGDWIRFLKNFYTKKGEYLIVYDKSQDIYNHGLWIEDQTQIQDIGFKGSPGTLNYSYRMPKEIIEKIHDIRKFLDIDGEKILSPKESYHQISLLSKIDWFNQKNESIDDKIEMVHKKYNELIKNNSIEDITILTTNENTGLEIVKSFNKIGINVSHVYDLDGEGDIEKRRFEKFRFVGGTGKLKVCSYHSYKGWQTPNIILVLDSNVQGADYEIMDCNETVNNCIFISISRVKPNSSTGAYSFTCFNYIKDYENLVKVFY